MLPNEYQPLDFRRLCLLCGCLLGGYSFSVFFWAVISFSVFAWAVISFAVFAWAVILLRLPFCAKKPAKAGDYRRVYTNVPTVFQPMIKNASTTAPQNAATSMPFMPSFRTLNLMRNAQAVARSTMA